LSIGFLSQLERGISNPSVKALHDVARALGVNISWFFDEDTAEQAEEVEYIVRSKRRRRLLFEGGISDELLSPTLGGQLELFYSRFQPGSSSGDAPYAHQGEEAGIVVSGSLELWVGERRFLLTEGDSFGFPSSIPHRYANPGPTETIVIWAVTPPSY